MEEQRNEQERPVNPRRKKRTKLQIFKEAYLPIVIAGLAIILIIIFIAGAIVRSSQKHKAETEASIAASIAADEEKHRLDSHIEDLLFRSERAAAIYDYDAAISILNTFEGDLSKYPVLNDKILEYEAAKRELVAWDDPSKIPNFSFQLLLADPGRGFSNSTYGSLINRNFITTAEFSKILQQLYDNGYILVDLDDIITKETAADGSTVYKAKTLYLPNGKKPIMLTQTNVNYNYYLIDSDGDKVADAKGTGIASKLLWDGEAFSCEMVDASGKTVTGDFDMVPILEKFIASHPGFSYRGARAILALTGYNGLFGYRTHPSAKNTFGEAAYEQAKQDAVTVAKALKEKGYTLACYTYENISYGDASVNQIKNDLSGWFDEAIPLIGDTNILVYAQMTDIAKSGDYTGDKFNTLQSLGFRIYLGFCEDGQTWTTVQNDYIRQGRIMVTGSNLAHHADWFAAYFDASSVLDSSRGNVPK